MAFRSFSGNERRGFSARRGRGGTQFFVKRVRTVVKPDIVKHPLGEIVHNLSISDLEPSQDNIIHGSQITDCKYIASYNWTNSKSPTVLVPGKPPLWMPLIQPQRLREDNGKYFRDPNAAKFPPFPTEPAVRALLNTDPNFQTGEVDIFACGSTMGNLIRFVSSADKPFRFQIELIGTTIFLVRKENDPREIIEDIRGFGHTFPVAYTAWEADVKGSETHQRLCRYNFRGLDCVIRFECDGYLTDGHTEVESSGTTKKAPDFDALLGSFKNVTVGPGIIDAVDGLTVERGGAVVPQSSIFDLKTRSGRFKREIDMNDIYPQLWVKQIPNFIIAYHDGEGTFPLSNIHVKNVTHEVRAWETRNKAAIQRLAVLLSKIIQIVKQDGTGLLEVYRPFIDRLEIRRQFAGGMHALPPDLRARWEGSNRNASSSDEEEKVGLQLGYDSDEGPDYTACGEDCGYCGKCTY